MMEEELCCSHRCFVVVFVLYVVANEGFTNFLATI